MSEQENVVELKLGTITRTVRVLAGAGPKVATLVGLGVVLAFDDAANDPAGELLGIKLVENTRSITSTVGFVARSSASKVGSVASSIGSTIGNRIERASTQEAKDARSAIVNRIPGIAGARAFITTAASEARQTWDAAGTISVEVATNNEDISLPSDVEGGIPELGSAVDPALTTLDESADLAITPEPNPTN